MDGSVGAVQGRVLEKAESVAFVIFFSLSLCFPFRFFDLHCGLERHFVLRLCMNGCLRPIWFEGVV